MKNNIIVSALFEFDGTQAVTIPTERVKDLILIWGNDIQIYTYNPSPTLHLTKAILSDRAKIRILTAMGATHTQFSHLWGRIVAVNSFFKWYENWQICIRYKDPLAEESKKEALKYAMPSTKEGKQEPNEVWVPYSRETLEFLFY